MADGVAILEGTRHSCGYPECRGEVVFTRNYPRTWHERLLDLAPGVEIALCLQHLYFRIVDLDKFNAASALDQSIMEIQAMEDDRLLQELELSAAVFQALGPREAQRVLSEALRSVVLAGK